MFSIKQNTPTWGDATCGFTVTLDKDYTVQEFINTVLENRPKEWGYIGIYKKNTWFGDPNCEYSSGKIITSPIPIEYMNKKVMHASADGGWSRMDYILHIEGDNTDETI